PVKAIKEQIAGAVNLFVQIGRLSDGSRKVKYITEVEGLTGEIITLSDIFVFKELGFDAKRKIQGVFQSTGTIPKCIKQFEARGVYIPDGIFSNEKPAVEADKNAKKNEALRARRRAVPAATGIKKVSNG